MRLINTLLFLFLILIALIIAHDISATYKWNHNVKREIQDNLQFKLTIAYSVFLNELDKFNHMALIVGELNTKLVPLIEYDKYHSIDILLKNISSLHNIDLMFLLDDEERLAASNVLIKNKSHQANFDLSRPKVELISYPLAQLAEQFEIDIPQQRELQHVLCIRTFATFRYDNGDLAGRIVMLKIINNHTPLVQRMAKLANANIVIYDKYLQKVNTNFTQKITRNKQILQDENNNKYLTKTQSLKNTQGRKIAEIMVAIDDRELKKKYVELGIKSFLPLIIMLTLSFLLIFILKIHVFDHVKTLIHGLRNVANGNLKTRLPVLSGNSNEISNMMQNFNLTMQKLEHFYSQLQENRTELKSLNQQLTQEVIDRKKAEQAAEKANKAKTKLMGIAAHDIRGPLGGILANLEILQDSEVQLEDAARQECIETAYTAVNQLLTLANDMLDSSVIETGELKLQLSAQPLQPLIEQRLKIYALLAHTKEIQINTDFKTNPIVFMDKNRVVQVFDNLIHNAIKFSLAGSCIEVRLEAIGRYAKVTIGNENVEKAIDESFTGDRELTQKIEEKSTGLGLIIAKKIIKRHQGHFLFLKTIPNKTSAEFTIPLYK